MRLYEVAQIQPTLLEYLTPEQVRKYSEYEMDSKVRKATDHFFGVGVDSKREDLLDPAGSLLDKSEVHKAVERALNQNISIDDYKRGLIKDRYGREVKIGRLIKDEKLRNQYASDNTKAGSKKSGYYVTIHRGVQVAGQTNEVPDANHPRGHSWHGQSCKNVETGGNKHYLKNEIQAGTVVMFVHDHTGQEIYRATLHPARNSAGALAYHFDTQYGVSNPLFTQHAKDVARRLCGPFSGSPILKVSRFVYSDSGERELLHPELASNQEAVRKLFTGSNSKYRAMAIPLLTTVTIDDVLNILKRKTGRVYQFYLLCQNPAVTPELISQIIALPKLSFDLIQTVVKECKNITSENIREILAKLESGPTSRETGLKDDAFYEFVDLIGSLAQNSKADSATLSRLIEMRAPSFLNVFVGHPNMTRELYMKLITRSTILGLSNMIKNDNLLDRPEINNDAIMIMLQKDIGAHNRADFVGICEYILKSRHANEKVFEQAYHHTDIFGKRYVIRYAGEAGLPLPKSVLDDIMTNRHIDILREFIQSSFVTPKIIDTLLDSPHKIHREVAAQAKTISTEQLQRALDDKEPHVVGGATQNKNISPKQLSELMKGPYAMAALDNPKVTSDIAKIAFDHPVPVTARKAKRLYDELIKSEEWEAAQAKFRQNKNA